MLIEWPKTARLEHHIEAGEWMLAKDPIHRPEDGDGLFYGKLRSLKSAWHRPPLDQPVLRCALHIPACALHVAALVGHSRSDGIEAHMHLDCGVDKAAGKVQLVDIVRRRSQGGRPEDQGEEVL